MWIQVQQVNKYFTGRDRKSFAALSDIDFEVEKNEFICIVGPSGCGKTVLLDILGGFSRPSSGRVLIGGQEVTGPSPSNVTIFQDYKLLPWRTVRKNIEFGLMAGERRKRMPRSDIDRIVSAQIESVGLTGFEDYRPSEISGGMKQRVAIARAFAVEPEIIFMDEPFGALDSITKEAMQLKLKHLLNSGNTGGKTVLFVTHDVDEAISLADRIFIMKPSPGRIHSIVNVRLPMMASRYSRAFSSIRDKVMSEMAIVSNINQLDNPNRTNNTAKGGKRGRKL